MKITNEHIKQWIKALRSGQYPQTNRTLKEVDKEGNLVGYCCLGLFKSAVEGVEPAGCIRGYDKYGFSDHPNHIYEGDGYDTFNYWHIEYEDDDGEPCRIDSDVCTTWNDREGYTFKQIADQLQYALERSTAYE